MHVVQYKTRGRNVTYLTFRLNCVGHKQSLFKMSYTADSIKVVLPKPRKTLNSERARDDGFSPIRHLNSESCLCSKYVFCRESSICLRYSCKVKFQS
jgi:hypothetical protein